ncbi:ABC transporter permease [bacterium]|nr:ABC transporter permease [bacterium]
MNDFWEELVQSLGNLKGNKTRSFLTMLGVVVGVMAIIGIISIGEAGKLSIKKDLESFGSNLAAIWADKREDTVYKPLNNYDVEFLRSLPFIKDVSPTLSLYREVRRSDKRLDCPIMGVSPSYFGLNNRHIEKGRFFSSFENNNFRRVCVITEGIKKELFERHGIDDPVGHVVKIGDFPFFVIGVMKKIELQSFLSSFVGEEKEIYVPERTVKTTFGISRINYILFGLKEGVKPTAARKSLTSMFRLRKGRNTYYGMQFVENQINAFSSVMNTVTMIITLIGALSLFVGGVGIMNIMFISVTERTREIGIRKSLGATQVTILRQFLNEAVILSLLGAFAGIAIGSLVTLAVEGVIKWKPYISPGAIVLSVFFSLIIGVVFGIIPAKKASALHPIDALRYE